MSSYLNQVMAAIKRVDHRERPEPDDVRIIRPMLADLEAELVKDDPIRFSQVGLKFIVDMTSFPGLLGFGYTQALLQQPKTLIWCSALNPVPMLIKREDVISGDMIKTLVRKKKQLQWTLKDGVKLKDYKPEDVEYFATELQQIEEFLSKTTFGGKSISCYNDLDRNRQAVCKAITLTLTKIEEHPDTRHIGEHLRQNIKLGYNCAYTGDWQWKFSQKSQNGLRLHTLYGRGRASVENWKGAASRFVWPQRTTSDDCYQQIKYRFSNG